MAVPRGNLFFQRDLLESDARWQIRESIRTLEDISRYCKPNHAIDLSRGTGDVSFCVLISAGCSHIAAVEASAARRKIQVTVYHLKDGFDQKWSVTYDGPDQEFQGTSRSSFYDTTRMHGGITEDGQSVLLIYQPSGGGRAGAYVVNANGFTWRSPPSDTGSSYIASPGELSADSECLFYTRSGAAFGRNGEAKVVEAYSIRHLARLQATSFGFGDGVHMRNTRLLPQPRIKGPIYLAIETSSFSRDDDEQLQYSPPVLVSSDKKLQWNFAGIDSISSRGATSTFVSPDDSHLFYMEPDAAMLHHWDLKKPTLRPLGAVRLPGVEYSEARPWTVYGKIQNIKDAIPQQLHQVRFSTGCKTVTIVTVNDISVVVNVLLTFNLQLIYHQIVTIPRQTWSTYIPARIGFDETAGLNVFAMCPSRIRTTQNQLPEVLGLTGLLISLPDVFQKIKAVEEYFDLSGARLSTLMSEVENREARPELRFSWRPGVMDRNDPDAIHLEQGQPARTSPVDARRQEQFYNRVFADSQSSVWMHSTPELRRFFVPHLFSFTYPWAPESRVSVFGVVMKNEYHIVSIGPSPSNPSSDTEVLRALYTTDIRVSEEEMDHIEIYQNGTNYFLHVCKLGDQYGSYSGAPMPISRWTLLSPHFLEEDAWYDTFVIHRAGHVTMPHNWTKTPNPALYATANYYAYFVPKTFTHLEVVDYGHRSRSAYVLPKHLLWREYGLRGLRKSNPNDIFFGGGRFADSLGRYLRSIYDDKTYDESNPLFPTSFAMACNIGHRAQKTDRIDAFFRRLHDDSILLLNNSSALSCTLPLACKTRPIAALSLMRFISLYKHRINNIGSVEVKAGATSPKVLREINGKWSRWQFWFQQQIYYPVIGLIIQPLFNTQTNHGEPNTSHVTLPLPGFCSFHHKLYRAPPMLQGLMGLLGADDPIWEFIRATSPDSKELFFNRDTYLFALTRSSGQSAASPFTRLVEEILDMQDREIQLSFLKVVWLEKLLAWKMKTFGLYIYLTRTALPMLLLFSAHLAVGVCLTQDVARDAVHITPLLVFLACIEALGTCFILSVKVRQLHRIPRLFFRSIFNYIDGAAICLGLVTFFLVVSRNSPSRPFLGFSTLVIWIATVLTLRVYRPVGILLLLLTETIIGVFSFLVLLFFIILGISHIETAGLYDINISQDSPSCLSSSFEILIQFNPHPTHSPAFP